MATLFLITSLYAGSRFHFAGEAMDDVFDAKDIAALQGGGALFAPATHGGAAAAAALAQTVHSKQAGRPELCNAIMLGAMVEMNTHLPRLFLGAGLSQTPDLTAAKRYVMPLATLAGATTITLAVPTAGSQVKGQFPVFPGTRRTFTRLDVSANTLAFVNGGPAGGTLKTLPVSAAGTTTVEWNGTDWELVS